MSRSTVFPPNRPTYDLSLLAMFSELTGELVKNLNQQDFFAKLSDFFGRIINQDNFIVYRYRERFAAELIATNLDFATLKGRMAPYINGLYLLDPFYIAATTGRRRGVLRIDEIAPEAFVESDYFDMFYKDVNVIDEVRFVNEFNGDELIHVFLEREGPHERFDDSDIQRLRDLEPLIAGLVEQHWRWRASQQSESRLPLTFGLRNIISSLHNKALTPREIDIAELTFKGHSSKSIAHELRISEGTVLSHKRHIYEKLEISSQTQFFHLLLQALYGSNLEATRPST
jgi:DNA-binding CsgD family transcriptional regulator